MPKGLTAATGMDALTHAIEGYITKGAWELTDMMHLKAIEIIARSLRAAVENDPKGREDMALGQYVAGMGFSNVGLGIVHSMAHPLGAFYDTPHGVANALILTEVMRYNADDVPTKMGTFSQYQYPHALERYAELGRFAGCAGSTDEEVFEKFLAKLEVLKEKIGIKKTIREYGIDERYFLDTLDEMVEQAFNDQCTGANPRYPLMSEIKQMYLNAYYGVDETV